MAVAISTLAVKDGNGAPQTLPVRVDASGNEAAIHSLDSSSPHYRAGFSALTTVATPTVIALITGSATTTVRVKKIVVTGAATAACTLPIKVEMCSTAATTGGTLTACTVAALDSNNTTATATFRTVGTANITTVPASIGIIGAGRLQLAALGAGSTIAQNWSVPPFVVDFTQNSSQAAVLRGTTASITISLAGATTQAGTVLDGYVEFEEAPLNAG